MKFDDIDAFVAVVRSQSLSDAARALGLTQPAITRRVQNLEEALGVALLDRQTKPARPTADGLRVYEQCRAVQREVDGLRALVAADAPPSGVLRLGLTQALGDVVLRPAMEALRAAFPALQSLAVTDWGGRLVERVADGELDAAAAWLPAAPVLPTGVEGEALARSELVVVAAKGEVASARRGRLADWHRRGWILNPDGCGFRAALQHALAAQGLPLLLRLDTHGRTLQLELIAAGHGIGLVPRPLLQASALRDALAEVPLADFRPAIELWLLRRAALHALAAPVAAFGRLVAETLSAAAEPA